jgi:hypothetical protein
MNTETVIMINFNQIDRIKAEQLLAHAKTMCMMYKIFGDKSYLHRAKTDINKVKTITKG